MTEETYKLAFDCLTNAGFEVYPPQTKRGKCLKPYIILRDGGSSQWANFSSAIELLDVMLYVPLNRYTDLFPLKKKILAAMKTIYPTFQSTMYESSSFFDDDVDAHMLSIEYQIHTYRG